MDKLLNCRQLWRVRQTRKAVMLAGGRKPVKQRGSGLILGVGRNGAAGRLGRRRGKPRMGGQEGLTPEESTGIGGEIDEPVCHAPGELAKGIGLSGGMAADLAMVEDQRQGISQKPDHGQHDQRRGLVHGRMFEMTVGGDGLKNLGIDSPPAAAELMDEQRRELSMRTVLTIRTRRLATGQWTSGKCQYRISRPGSA